MTCSMGGAGSAGHFGCPSDLGHLTGRHILKHLPQILPNFKRMMRLWALMFISIAWAVDLVAQRPTVEDFTISGDTYLTDEECFRLTDEVDYSSGSIWYRKPIDLRESFSIRLSIMAGCEDRSGADGMVFAFTPQANITGFRGEGIGYSGLRPSVGIEIDTWLNEHLGDPIEDHLAIMVNGRVGHWNDLAGPVKIPNIEDCNRHGFYIHWNATTQRLAVEIDGQELIAAQFDLVGKIFGGNPVVYWGMTAATGRYNNMHEVCFDRLAYSPPKNSDEHLGQ